MKMGTEPSRGQRLMVVAAVVALAGCATATALPDAATQRPTTTGDPTATASLPPRVAATLSPTLAADPASSSPQNALAGEVPTYRGDAARTGRMPGPGPSGAPRVAWKFQAGGSFESSPVVRAGAVYALSGDGVLHAIDLRTGKERWRERLGARAHASPLIVGDTVIVADDHGSVRALAQADGSLRWTVATDGQVSGSPAAGEDEVVIAATETGTALGIDGRSGRILWHAQAGGPVQRSIAISAGIAYVGISGEMIAITVDTGLIRWRSRVGTSGSVGTPAVSDGVVYAGIGIDGPDAADHGVVALDAETGRHRWRYASPTLAQVYTPAIAGGRAYVVGHDRLVVCVDALSGAVEWSVARPTEVEALPVVSDSVVYAIGNDGPAAALDAETGAVRWTVPIRGVPFAPVVVDGYLILGTDVGSRNGFAGPS
jgi:outer membrane protein assembly factor BamB